MRKIKKYFIIILLSIFTLTTVETSSLNFSALDFAYDIEDYMRNFIGQELELYSFDTKLTTLSFSEEDIYPFFSYIYSESEKDKVEKAYCMSNAVDMYCKIFKPDY